MNREEEPSGHIGQTEGEYSVVQFFVSGEYEYTRRWVGLEEACQAAKHYSSSVAARTGIVRKVIITDGGDCTNLVWEFGKGLTYPTREMLDGSRI
jgi:hypothetical protein